MVLPAGVLTALGELAMSPKVQDFASGLVKNVYGRIMPSKAEGPAEITDEEPALSLSDLASRLDDLPRRDELVASFAVLQAELDRQNIVTRRFVIASVVLQSVLLATVLIWISW